MKKLILDEQKILHILRNPHGWTEEERRLARNDAAELIERYRAAYKNMKEWAEENGLDTVAKETP